MSSQLDRFPYQPLRLPPGWLVDWNTFSEHDPTIENVKADWFGGSSLFTAINTHLRLIINVTWSPEDDPDGKYLLLVKSIPWKRTDTGQRIKEATLDFTQVVTGFEYQTTDRLELVHQLEQAFIGNPQWVEAN